MKQIDFDCQVRSVDEKDYIIEGAAIVFGVRDTYDTVFDAGSFVASIEERGGSVPLLYQHSTSEPIGTAEVREQGNELHMVGRLVPTVTRAKEAYDLVTAGALRGLSVGFLPRQEYARDGQTHYSAVDLWEVSLVTFASNPRAAVTSVRMDSEITKRELEEILIDAGFSRHAAKAFIARGYEGLCRRDDDGVDALQRLLDAIKGGKPNE